MEAMDSWNYAYEEKGLPHLEGGLPIDALTSRKALMEWDYGSPCNVGKGLILDGEVEVAECMEIMGMGVSDNMKNYFTPSAKTASCKSYSDIGENVASPNMVSSSLSLGEEIDGLMFSSSLLEGHCQVSSLIDLKLVRQANCKEPQNIKVSKESFAISFVGSSSATKKTRSIVSNSQTPFCQVHGCNMDLSSSKDYHKRHRVCDVHSKTPRVTVHGVEQRFCQQCSRFHLLHEFDDNKRSCRRRLSGHNERRRKPKVDSIYCRPQKVLHFNPGTKFLGTSLLKGAPSMLANTDASSIFNAEKQEQADQHANVKRVEQSVFSSNLPVSLINKQLFLESYSLHGPVKKYSSTEASSRTENHAFLDPPLDVKELTRVSSSSSALSLLSADSDNFSSQLAIFAAANSLASQVSQVQHRGKATGKSLGTTNTSDGLYSCDMNNVEVDPMGSAAPSNVTHPVDSGVELEKTYQSSIPLNAKYCFPPDCGSTVDLLQLSSHLLRVEQERSFTQGKLGNDNV